MKYKILTNRFAEWKYGDIADMDDEAARVPLEIGEIIPYIEGQEEEKKEIETFVCDVCGKVCKNKLGLNSHRRQHVKKV